MDAFPADSTAERRRGRWPSGLVAMLGLVALIELTVFQLGDRLQTPTFTGFRFTSRAIKAEAPKAEILVVGDSLLKYGVVPLILEKAIGSRAYNLAHIGGQPPDTYFALRQALDRGARPAAIVLDFKANMLQADPRFLAAERVELYDLADCIDMGWCCRSLSYGSTLLLAGALPSYKYRAPIRGEILAALNNQPWPGNADVPTYRRNWERNLGANVAPRNPGAKDVVEHWDEKAYLTPTFLSHPSNHLFIKRTLGLASRHRVPVYWLIPPINPRVQARREQLGVDAAFAAYVRSFLAKWPDLVVVDGRHAGYDASLFVDAAHLDHVGASAFTTALAEVLRRGKGGPRWVELPGYREPKAAPPLEDMDQSRVALKRLGPTDGVLR